MSGFFGVIDDVNVAAGDDEVSLMLHLLTEDGEAFSFVIGDWEQLVRAVEPLARDLADKQAVQRERASWAGYDLSGATEGEWLRYAADLTRKKMKEAR